MHLITETIRCLEYNNKTVNDVCWVGSQDGTLAITFQEFEKISSFEYNSGFGGQVIASDLVVVGKDWWLERHEYDGSEWWEFKESPVKSMNAVGFNKVKGELSFS